MYLPPRLGLSNRDGSTAPRTLKTDILAALVISRRKNPLTKVGKSSITDISVPLDTLLVRVRLPKNIKTKKNIKITQSEKT